MSGAGLWRIERVEETGSTNVDLAQRARDGADEGAVIVARYQSAGRGRLARTWESAPGASVMASFLIRPDSVPADRWSWLPLLVGVAVVDALDQVAGLTAMLKWPNDVLIGDGKLAGILVERVDTPVGPAAVAGVGLNVHQQLGELPEGATSVAVEMHSSRQMDVDTEAVLGAICHQLGAWYPRWRATGGDPAPALWGAYRRRCATLGRRVRADLPGGGPVVGVAVDVDASGRLVIDTGSGPATVGAGDVVHLRTLS